MTAREIE